MDVKFTAHWGVLLVAVTAEKKHSQLPNEPEFIALRDGLQDILGGHWTGDVLAPTNTSPAAIFSAFLLTRLAGAGLTRSQSALSVAGFFAAFFGIAKSVKQEGRGESGLPLALLPNTEYVFQWENLTWAITRDIALSKIARITPNDVVVNFQNQFLVQLTEGELLPAGRRQ